jgi:DNA-binding CsgD family transcriptional regulator
MPIVSATSQAAVHRLWDDLADFDRSDGESSLVHLLGTLARLVHAQNAWWLGIVRVSAAGVGDPAQNWRPGAIRYLHETPQDRKVYRHSEAEMSRGAIDETSIANVRDAGTFRVLWLPEIASPAWYKSSFYRMAYQARGIRDAVFVGCPVNREAESIIGFHRIGARKRRFSAKDRAVLGYALRGLRWFQRQVLLDHGLLVARLPLTPMEHRVLRHLLTDMPEREIAAVLGLARPTTHNHVTAIFRKFGVNSRAGLMALWVGGGAS